MKNLNLYTALSKTLGSGLMCSGVLLASLNAQASTQQEISQVPLNLSEGVPPNIIVTIDESTSMDGAYVPDGIWYRDYRPYRSNSFNPMYYNPELTYLKPPSFNKNGSEKNLFTAFNRAYLNGFKPKDNEWSDLSKDYTVALNVKIRDSNTTLETPTLYNPAFDFKCEIRTSLFKRNNDFHACDGNWHADKIDSWSTRTGKITITRTSSSKCSAVMEVGDIRLDAPCSQRRIGGTDHFVADLTKTPVPAYYYLPDSDFEFPDGNKLPPNPDNIDCHGYHQCYRLVFVTDKSGVIREDDLDAGRDERQNFANWYSFYRTRSLATISAASLAFYNLSPSTRVTWQNLSDCTQLNKSNAYRCGDNRFQEFSAKHRGEFYYWMQNMRMNNATPLRAAMDRAGKFLRNDPAAWEKYPNDTSKTNNDDNTYACRASYHVLMTDGMWNGADARGIGKTYNDDSNINLPVGSEYQGTRPNSYTPKAPYSGGGSNTLADVAMNYWAMDLNPDLDNRVKPYDPFKDGNELDIYWDPRNNPADWQHMVNFIMGLGLTNSLNDPNIPWEGGTFIGEGYKKLVSGAVNWPTAGAGSANVYDLWHAAINSRGEFFSVDSPEDMVSAFDSILSRIADRKASAAMPGVSSSIESDGDPTDPSERLASYFYQTSFDSASGWSGNVQKVKKYREWNPNTNTFDDLVEEGWNAQAKMPAHTARKIWMASGTSELKEFKVANAGSPSTYGTLAYWLNFNPDPSAQVATWSDRLNFLRGDRSREGEEDGKLRVRTSILGDFLASQPAVVTGARYLEGFANKLEGNNAYTAYMSTVSARRGQLYIGGNDGMLHAFDTESGKEEFAFVPTAVFPTLNKLTGKNYSHQFYVDGTPVIADIYNRQKGEWLTILVGTLRAGGKGLFALDITDPDKIKLLWELDESSAAVKNLSVKPGFSFSQPTVARLHNGRWAVVTGNGYKGEGTNNGAAALYIIDAITGELTSSLEVQSSKQEPNGLSTPRLADYDSDGIADYAYAGDLHGNLWRFDLLGAGATGPTLVPPSNGSYGATAGNMSNFKVAYGGQPMFTATSTVGNNQQPITSAPSLVRHPTRNGYLVIFGTGRYVEVGDKTGEKSFAQSLYGIWDQKTKAETTTAAQGNISRSKLVKQSIESQTSGTGVTSGVDRVARIISNEPIEWYKDFDSTKSIEKHGWYLDLQTSAAREGEMMIENMRLLGNTLLMQTLIPNDDPCSNGSESWLYALNPTTGGRTLHHAFDTQTSSGDIVGAIKFGSEGGISISQDEVGFKANAPGVDPEPIYLSPDSMGRQSWRMLPDA